MPRKGMIVGEFGISQPLKPHSFSGFYGMVVRLQRSDSPKSDE